MQTDELDEILKREPSWQPPPGFARKVVARSALNSRQPRAGAPRSQWAYLQATAGLAAAAGAYVVGLLLSALVDTLVQETVATVDGYARFMELTARAIASRAVLTSWICAALSLGVAASMLQRARD
jgi:hypothetical protein